MADGEPSDGNERRSEAGDSRTRRTEGLIAACLVACATFWLYHATLLPGFDFGDTGSFQATVGSSLIDARKAYPLYFALGNAIIRLTRAEPAYALNIASAVAGAMACGLLALVATELSGSIVAAVGAALLFGVSYTFWSQAIIAEVYAFHIVFVALTLLLLLRWQRRPTRPRLALFFAVYACGFGNHLSMILLAPGYAAFLLLAAPDGWRSMLRPRVVVLALACALAGALQYAPSLRALWLMPDPPAGIRDALQTFWFDVTKSDWRDTTVLTVPRSMLVDRGAMYWFDLTQQFGIVGPLLAAIGAIQLAFIDLKRWTLMILLYAAAVSFAFSYNVGDSHVFYLTSHVMLALLAASGVAVVGRLSPRAPAILGVLLAGYAVSRAYDDMPALDRSHDVRPTEVMRALTRGIDDQDAVLVTHLNWQLQNGLAYFAKITKPEVAHAWMPDIQLYAPAFVDDNVAIGRRVVVTTRARDNVVQAYGPLFTVVPDPAAAPAPSTLLDVVRSVPAGTRYVLCVLKPLHEYAIDRDDLLRALRVLSPSVDVNVPTGDYAVAAGLTGEAPVLVEESNRPFRRDVLLGGVDVDVRMESWLGSDTIRRMGFGHVSAARKPTLIVERGISFVTFGSDGGSTQMGYFANLFEPLHRYLIGTAEPRP